MDLSELVTGDPQCFLEDGPRVYEPPEFARAVHAKVEELRDAGLAPRSTSVVNIELSADYVFTLLAMLSMDIVVVPADPRAPEAVVEDIVCTSRAATVVGVRGVDLLGRGDESGLGGLMPDLQYILFTSGSTGRPKGVLGTRSGLLNRIRWGADQYYGSSVKRIGIRTNPTFHDSLTEILCSVASGHHMVVAPATAQRDIGELVHFASSSGIDQITIAPSTVPVLARAAKSWPLVHLKRWVFSGEELRADWCDKVREFSPNAEIINSYGSTEVTGDVAYFTLGPSENVPDPMPLGRAVPGVTWEIASDGELVIGGVQVALGYVTSTGHDTRQAFDVSASEAGGRGFKTGDKVAAEGDLLFYRGRRDSQAKVRGRRIDLNGISAVLESLPEVTEAFAWVEEHEGLPTLVAAVALLDPEVAVATLLSALSKLVPGHLVPDRIVRVPSLPRTISGKVDRRRLLARSAPRPIPRETEFATGMEYAVAVAVAEVIGNGEFGPLTLLSETGLDSLRSVMVAQGLSRTFDCGFDGASLRALNTVQSIAQEVLRLQAQVPCGEWRYVRQTEGPVVVFIHPAIGTGLGYFPMIARLRANASIALLEQSQAATEILVRDGVDGLARYYASVILRECPGRPVHLVGYSFGGAIVPALVREGARLGVALAEPVLIDPRIPDEPPSSLRDWALRRILSDSGYESFLPRRELDLDGAMHILTEEKGYLAGVSRHQVRHWSDSLQANSEHLVGYQPPLMTGPATVVFSAAADAVVGGLDWLAGSVPDASALQLDCSHYELLRPPRVSEVAELIGQVIGAPHHVVSPEEGS